MKNRKQIAVAFKADAKLAELLNQLPNKSEFIRKAIVAQIAKTCPLCKGTGSVPRGIHDHFESLIRAHRDHPCATCGHEQHLPDDPGELSPEDRDRLEQFFNGGPLYCNDCYQTAPPCTECGWHVDAENINDHVRSHHAEQD